MAWYPCPGCCDGVAPEECDLCQNNEAPHWVCVEVSSLVDDQAGIPAAPPHCCEQNLNGFFQLEFVDAQTAPEFADPAAFNCPDGAKGPVSWCHWRCIIELENVSPFEAFPQGDCSFYSDTICLSLFVYNCSPTVPNYTVEFRIHENKPGAGVSDEDYCSSPESPLAGANGLIWQRIYGATKPDCNNWNGESIPTFADVWTGCNATDAVKLYAGPGLPPVFSCCTDKLAGEEACCYPGSIPNELTVTIAGASDCASRVASCDCADGDCADLNATYVLELTDLPQNDFHGGKRDCRWSVPIDPPICGWTRLDFVCRAQNPYTTTAHLYLFHPTDTEDSSAFIPVIGQDPANCLLDERGECNWNNCNFYAGHASLPVAEDCSYPRTTEQAGIPYCCNGLFAEVDGSGDNAVKVTVSSAAFPCTVQINVDEDDDESSSSSQSADNSSSSSSQSAENSSSSSSGSSSSSSQSVDESSSSSTEFFG